MSNAEPFPLQALRRLNNAFGPAEDGAEAVDLSDDGANKRRGGKRSRNVALTNKIRLSNARFFAPETEKAYQIDAYPRRRTNNLWGASLGLAWFLAYAFADYIDTHDPSAAIITRLVFGAIAGVFLALIYWPKTKKYHDALCAGVVTSMSLGINVIIYLQPDLEHTYYIGIINGLVFFSLLLRLSFEAASTTIISTISGFAIVAFSAGDPSIAALQTADLIGIGIICAVGIYLLNRYQRVDFIKSETIRQQNSQLTDLLSDARKDHERKVAALNMLLHMVRTPIHQISGFTDLVLARLNTVADVKEASECIDDAKYIKEASIALQEDVAKLLAYHKLDDIARTPEIDTIPLRIALEDALVPLEDMFSIETKLEASAVDADKRSFETALENLVACLKATDTGSGVLKVEANTSAENAVDLTFAWTGESMTADEFDEAVKPLTEIENYLNNLGRSLPMDLRTAARAMEVIDGEISYQPASEDGQNILTLRFKSAVAKAPEKPKKAKLRLVA